MQSRGAGIARVLFAGSRMDDLPSQMEHRILLESSGDAVRNRMYFVVLSYMMYAAVAFAVFMFLNIRQNDLKYAFLAVFAFGVLMAITLLVQTRAIGPVVVFEHGVLVPYHAKHPIPAFTRYNKVIPWKEIIGLERRHGLRLILADGRSFLILLHHDNFDELEAVIRHNYGGR
jgi:hypothetical protein